MLVCVQVMPHCAGQLFSREHVGLSSCSQGPAKAGMLRYSAKIRCQTATGARSPTYPNNCGESGSPYSWSRISEFYREHNVQKPMRRLHRSPQILCETRTMKLHQDRAQIWPGGHGAHLGAAPSPARGRQSPRARHIAGAAPGLCAQPGMAPRCAELHRNRPSALYNHHAIYPHLFLAFTDHQSAGCSQRPAGNHTSFSPAPDSVCHIHTNSQSCSRSRLSQDHIQECLQDTWDRERLTGGTLALASCKGWLHSSAAARCSVQPKPALWALHPGKISGGAVFTKKFLQRLATNEREIIHMASTVILMGYLSHHCYSCLLEQRSGA